MFSNNVKFYCNSSIERLSTYYTLTTSDGEYLVFSDYQTVKSFYKNDRHKYINQPISINGGKLLRVLHYYDNLTNLHHHYFPKNYKVAYVDGSCRPLDIFHPGGRGSAAWGGVVIESNSEFTTGSTCINHTKLSDQSDLITSIEAECRAVEYIAQLFSSDNILFIGDCSSAKRHVDKTINGQYTSLTKFLNNRQFGYFLIPGHAGIKYNMMIDKMVNYTNRVIRGV